MARRSPAARRCSIASAAAGAVGGAERFEPAAAIACGDAHVGVLEPGREHPDQRGGTKGMSHATQTTGAGATDIAVSMPPREPEAWPYVGGADQLRAPRPGGGVVGHEERSGAERVSEGMHETVEDAFAPDRLQPLGASAESGGLATGQDGPANAAVPAAADQRRPRRRSSTTSNPRLKLMRCLMRVAVGGGKPSSAVAPVTARTVAMLSRTSQRSW